MLIKMYMKNNNYSKILFNTVFTIILSIVTLNACQDSGGKNPAKKARTGKDAKKTDPESDKKSVDCKSDKSDKKGTDKTLEDCKSDKKDSDKPTVEEDSGKKGSDDNNKKKEESEANAADVEKIKSILSEMSHDFRDSWSVANKVPNQTPDNIFESTKLKLSKSELIRKVEDKKASCLDKKPYIFRIKNEESTTETSYEFGIYDCAKQEEKEVMTIKVNADNSKYIFEWNYSKLANLMEPTVLEYDGDLKPVCTVTWDKSAEKITKLECVDVGQTTKLSNLTNSARNFKKIIIEGDKKILNLEWEDYAMKKSDEDLTSPYRIEDSLKTAEKKESSDKIFVCPIEKSKTDKSSANKPLDCEDYYEKCETNSSADDKTDPICGEGEKENSSRDDAAHAPEEMSAK
jgi:hypothetical protein